jgi:hypothetical protein
LGHIFMVTSLPHSEKKNQFRQFFMYTSARFVDLSRQESPNITTAEVCRDTYVTSERSLNALRLDRRQSVYCSRVQKRFMLVHLTESTCSNNGRRESVCFSGRLRAISESPVTWPPSPGWSSVPRPDHRKRTV